MTKRTNLKTAEETPEKLTYEQIEALARELTGEYDTNGQVAEILLNLADEIVQHCKEFGHVEVVAFVLRDALYAASSECAESRDCFIEQLRSEVKGGAR